ncbi:hypothetical protein AMC99_01650 [Altererythrobacter epoxidivorans]|uniref:DUF4197 domain-containing protein n=1 Tax=Altererythrobacter epoxidivorans TaxID=361183 RepID=A0A0M4LV44_9SPHN|nr:DUF4197 domain-containing protein [Altererythrobacter epoxidivorans]ALE16941.1 hypothetical protein AMC99_01650 [Altererythrobacter epoxidivorans]
MSRFLNRTTASPMGRRNFIGGMIAGGSLLALPACSTLPGFSFTEAIRRMLLLSSERAFARLTAPDGYWDQQVGRVGLGNLLGTRGDVLSTILTSALFKSRLEDAFADIAIEGSYRAAPVVADAVRVIGIQNAIDLVRGGPSAATSFLRGEMGGQLIEVMVPELGDAIRIASDPLVGQLINAATGTNVSGIANRLAGNINDSIWTEMGVEEAAIRANPEQTRDPVIIGVFGAGNAI